MKLGSWKGGKRWIRKMIGKKNMLLLELQQNRNGRFGPLSEISINGRVWFILIPEGFDGNGWRSFVNFLGSFGRPELKKPSQNVVSQQGDLSETTISDRSFGGQSCAS
ncbi:hypothetical protein L1049_008340 [Liquidambar formosana]